MQFPSDEVLIARGKFSTRSKDRREQLERVQKICTTLMSASHAALRDCEGKPPVDGSHLQLIGTCLKNLTDAREKLINLSLELAELEPDAWGKEVTA